MNLQEPRKFEAQIQALRSDQKNSQGSNYGGVFSDFFDTKNKNSNSSFSMHKIRPSATTTRQF